MKTLLKLAAERLAKYSFGSVEADIDPVSEAGRLISVFRSSVEEADLAGKGRESNAHVTVRYGIMDRDTDDLREFLSQLSPFEITFGMTRIFPPNVHTEDAAVIFVEVFSDELKRLNELVAQHANYKEADFEYHSHATIAYVDPGAAWKYIGSEALVGVTYLVKELTICYRTGPPEVVPFNSVYVPMDKGWMPRDLTKRQTTWAPWIGCDLDGTLARGVDPADFDPEVIGEPIPLMVLRVQNALNEGHTVKIFTARVADDPDGSIEAAIKVWCAKHIGQELEVTCRKDPGMFQLWDDRVTRIEENMGTLAHIAKEYNDDQPRDEQGRWGIGGALTLSSKENFPQHIQDLKLPPAWTQVRINPDPHADLLAIGKDSKGRDQYVYSQKFKDSQQALKFERIKELDAKFDSIRAQNNANMRSKDELTREHAECASLVMTMGIRPGSETDTTATVKAYGATTLLGSHVMQKDGETRLQFIGKKGVAIDLPVTDRRVAAMLNERAAVAGKDGQLFPKVSDKSLLEYSHTFDGGGFKTKDFRTLLGTREATRQMGKISSPNSQKEYMKAVREVAVKVAEKLGNTPTVALQSYIHPAVFSPWRSRLAA
jgi:DNA topoisomerase-1